VILPIDPYLFQNAHSKMLTPIALTEQEQKIKFTAADTKYKQADIGMRKPNSAPHCAKRTNGRQALGLLVLDVVRLPF